MLSSDRTLSLVVAIETALEDRRFEASPLSCSHGLATGMAVAVLRLLLGWCCSLGLPGPPRAGTDLPAPTCVCTCTAGGCTPKR